MNVASLDLSKKLYELSAKEKHTDPVMVIGYALQNFGDSWQKIQSKRSPK